VTGVQTCALPISIAGAAIVGGFILAAKNFADSANENDAVAKRWKNSTDELTAAQMRLGRVAADVLNPAYEKLADIMTDIANKAGGNTNAASGVLGIGVSLLAGGTVFSGITKLASMLTGLAATSGSAGTAVAATAVAGAAIPVAVTALALGIGATIGEAIGNAVNKALNQPNQNLFEISNTAQLVKTVFDPITLAAAGMKAAGFADGAAILFNVAKMLNGLPIDVVSAVAGVDRGGGRGKIVPNQKSRNDYFQGLLDTAKEDARREALTHELNMKLIDAQKKLAADQTSITNKMSAEMMSFLNSENQAYTAYYNSRTDMIRSENIADQRAEKDHQKKIFQIHRDAGDQELQLAQSRDALGLVRAKRDEERTRSDEESNYRTEVKRRNQDLAEKLRIMDRDYALQRQYRLREYNLKMQTYQAEMEAAQVAYQSIINAIYQLRQASLINTGAPGQAASRAYAGIGTPGYGGSVATSNTTTVNIQGGALNMNQVQQSIDSAARRAALNVVGRAFAV